MGEEAAQQQQQQQQQGGDGGDGGQQQQQQQQPGGDEKHWSADAGLPETVMNWDEVKTSDNPEKFWESMEHFRSAFGSSVRIPGEDASPEQRAEFIKDIQSKMPELVQMPGEGDDLTAFLEKMGMPGEASGYGEVKYENVDGVEVSTEQIESMKSLAHKYGLTDGQFQGMMSEIITRDITGAQEGRAAFDADMKGLSGEWGVAFDAKKADALALAEQTGAPQGLIDSMKSGTANADTLKYFAGLAKLFGKEGTQLQNIETGVTLNSPQEAKDQINEILGNKKHAYWNSQDPGNADAKKKMRELNKQAYPGDAPGLTTVGAGAEQ